MKTIIIDGIEYNLTPKVLFKKGDFVVIQETTYQITKVENLNVTLSLNGRKCSFDIDVLKNAHLWDITKDAKDGDVLACPNDAGDRDVVFIFKNINSDEGWVFCFCAIDANGCFCTNNDYVGNSNSTNISPATKEQRGLLFQEMKEAGYEWDADEKKLKKIEQNPAWSEGDKVMLDKVIERLHKHSAGDKEYLDIYYWLIALKDRVQPQNKWKESLATADLENSLCDIQDVFSDTSYEYRTLGEAIEFIRCTELKPQWKPSEEQMEALANALSLAKNCGEESAFDLRTLQDDLKRLLKI